MRSTGAIVLPILAAAVSLILLLSGCGIISGDFFGREFGDVKEDTGETSFGELKGTSNTDEGEEPAEEQPVTDENTVTSGEDAGEAVR